MIRIVIADDETLLLEALAMMLSLPEDIEVVATARSGSEAVAQIERHQPDVALVDLQMPGLDGIGVVDSVGTSAPNTRCLILTSYARPGYLKKALMAGARGFLPKTTSAKVLCDVIRRINDGQRYVDPELSAEAIAAGDSPLTVREADVLELAATGAPVEEIALKVHLSVGTVRNYLSSAVTKLDAPNRHAAVSIARSRGWI